MEEGVRRHTGEPCQRNTAVVKAGKYHVPKVAQQIRLNQSLALPPSFAMASDTVVHCDSATAGAAERQ